MVFITPKLFARITYCKPSKGPDRYWKRRKILKMAAHFYGRRQNCYRVALRGVHRALKYATIARKFKHRDEKELYKTRLSAACEEHGFTYPLFKESLIRSNILLHPKILATLAVWEPRTFKCLTDFAWKKASEEGLNGIKDLGDPPPGVILRPMIIKLTFFFDAVNDKDRVASRMINYFQFFEWEKYCAPNVKSNDWIIIRRHL